VQLAQRYLDDRAGSAALAASVADIAAEADESAEPDLRMLKALRDSALARIVVPAAYGGRDERVDALAVTVVRESLMQTSAHLDQLFCMQGIGSYAVAAGGSEEIKRQWLPQVASMDALAALALTEPDVGSDLRSITTRVEAVGDELVINGAKSFISNGNVAAFYCVLAREGEGYSLVLVPAGASGLSVTATATIIAPHMMGELAFQDVRVPASHRLGAPGKGFSLVFATLGTFRVTVAGAAVGLAQAALDATVQHATTRIQFGRPMIEIGAVGQHLARSWTEIEAARAFTYHAAELARQDPKANLHLSSMAKVIATETAGRVTDACVQVMGRFGLVRDSTVERAYRVARPMRTYEGGTEVILDSLARQLARGAA
jgi:acyl-CoA dehydrogenase